MADLSIWIHGPEWGCSTTQIAVLQELLKKKTNANIDLNVVSKNAALFNYYFRDYVKSKQFSVQENGLVHQLHYSRSMNLSMTKTLASVSKNFLTKFVPLARKFSKNIKNSKPKLLVSGGLAEIGVLSKFMDRERRPATLFIFNYLLENSRFFKSKILSELSRKLFIKNYINYDFSVIQTFFPEREYKIKKELGNLKMTNIIVREPTKKEHEIRKELGLSSNEKLIFLAMGGARFFRVMIKAASKIIDRHPEIRFLLLPRENRELEKFRKLKGFIVPSELCFDTQNYVLASDIVVTKCGFSTVAEAIKFGTKIVSIHLPNHAEVSETEILLNKEGVIKNSIRFTDFINTNKIAGGIYKKIVDEMDNKESTKIMRKIRTDGAKQVADIYLGVIRNT